MATFEWRGAGELPDLQVKQIYCWVFNAKNEVIVVSKDGTNWQLPGGKPEPGEEPADTLARELHEETGLVVDLGQQLLKFIGYYVVSEPNMAPYLQLRYKVIIDSNEALKPTVRDDITIAKWLPLQEIPSFLPWTYDSGELSAATI